MTFSSIISALTSPLKCASRSHCRWSLNAFFSSMLPPSVVIFIRTLTWTVFPVISCIILKQTTTNSTSQFFRFYTFFVVITTTTPYAFALNVYSAKYTISQNTPLSFLKTFFFLVNICPTSYGAITYPIKPPRHPLFLYILDLKIIKTYRITRDSSVSV